MNHLPFAPAGEDLRLAISQRDEAIASMELALLTREEFLATAAHELRTPLTSLQLRLQFMRGGLNQKSPSFTAEKQSETLDVALAQVSRLNRLVDELLDASRMMGETLRSDRVPLELGQLVAAAIDQQFWQPACLRETVEVIADRAVIVDGDRFHLEQLVSSLLRNAGKYGGGKPIRVSVTANQGNALVTVEDHGIGISPGNQTRIFEKFERAVSSRSSSGMGLGLYIARKIAQTHDGTLSVESVLGKGSSFTLSMPLHCSKEI